VSQPTGPPRSLHRRPRQTQGFNLPAEGSWFWVEGMIDLFFYVDLVLNFFVAYEVRRDGWSTGGLMGVAASPFLLLPLFGLRPRCSLHLAPTALRCKPKPPGSCDGRPHC
jgi:hypothetical protein